MARRSRPEWDGQQLLPGMARMRSRRRRNGSGNAETVLHNACLEWLALHPGLVPMAWRNNSGLALLRNGGALKLAPKGSPDIVGWLADGRFLGIECKVPGEDVDDGGDQAEFLALIHRSGGVALVVHTVDELAADIRRICEEGGS